MEAWDILSNYKNNRRHFCLPIPIVTYFNLATIYISQEQA